MKRKLKFASTIEKAGATLASQGRRGWLASGRSAPTCTLGYARGCSGTVTGGNGVAMEVATNFTQKCAMLQ